MMRCECFADAPYPTILKAEHGMGEGMLGGRDYTGYYQRCDGKLSMGFLRPWMPTRRGDCHPDSVSVLGPAQVLHDKQAVPLRISGGEWGERRAECRRLRNKTITGSAISLLEESGVRGPVRRSPGYSLFLWYVVLLNKGGDTYERLHEGPAPAVLLGTGAF